MDMIDEDLKNSISCSFNKYLGKSTDELSACFLLNPKTKNYLEMVASRILGYKGKANQSLELTRSNVVIKTIKMQKNGKIKESMSFPNFEFKKIIETSWAESDLRKMFFTQTFLFVVFKDSGDETILSHIKFWKISENVLENEVKNVWDKTVEVIKNGNIVSGLKELKNGKAVLKTNFPGISFNGVCHVRPHARNSDDTYELPFPDKKTGIVRFTKQCFWLNNTYIEKIVGQDADEN